MPTNVKIQGQEPTPWDVTLPDHITFSQDGKEFKPGAVFSLDGKSPTLNINIHYKPDVLFGGKAHGILSFDVKDPDTYVPPDATAHYVNNVSNGLRGNIQINFFNELGVTLRDPPGPVSSSGGTVVIFQSGTTDNTAQAKPPPPGDSVHTKYAHFHHGDFPGFDVGSYVGPIIGATGYDPTTKLGGQGHKGAPNWLHFAGEIPVGGKTSWGMIWHQRDHTDKPDNLTFAVMLTRDAISKEDMAKLKADWDAKNKPTDPKPTDPNKKPEVWVEDTKADEGDPGDKTHLTFKVHLDGKHDDGFSVKYSTRHWEANAGARDTDYVPKSGTLKFGKDETVKEVQIRIKPDNKDENDERMYLILEKSSRYVHKDGDDRGVGTIIDDDATASNKTGESDLNPMG
jgi:hypothetical protein